MKLLLKILLQQDDTVTSEDVYTTFTDVGLSVDKTVQFHPFYTWTHHVFGRDFTELTVKDYLDAINVLTTELEMVKRWAAKIFVKCNPIDGVILVDDFVARVLIATPELDAADIEDTIENTDGTMRRIDVQFWVAEMLGDCGQEECNELMAILIEATEGASP